MKIYNFVVDFPNLYNIISSTDNKIFNKHFLVNKLMKSNYYVSKVNYEERLGLTCK